jgi:isopentenyl-diphosphate delta-isomerase
MADDHPIVSFDDEPLILVDGDDTVVGHADKARCHDGAGLLHRAFSVFLFDAQGALLTQQRSAQKRLWPGYWSNSCCSHPRRGESVEQAAQRRTLEELGLQVSLQRIYKFTYQASFGSLGSEHELCTVFVGNVSAAPQTNATEISATRFETASSLDVALADPHSPYTPWLRLEWQRLRQAHAPALASVGVQ